MKKQRIAVKTNYIFLQLIVFGLITFALFFGGILYFFFTVKEVISIRELEKSEVIEVAKITRIDRLARTPNNTIYFTLIKYDGKIYRTHLLKIVPGRIEVGDTIRVKFNEKRTSFLVVNFKFATYAGYLVDIVLFFICIFLSRLSFLATIDIYKLHKS